MTSYSDDPLLDEAPLEWIGYAGPAQTIAVYHAYGPALNRDLAAPHPDYTGWTDTRMRLDTQRMQRAGIGHILLAVDPRQVMKETEVWEERLGRFTYFADKVQLGVGLMVSGNGLTPADWASFQDWLVKTDWMNEAGVWREENRPLVWLVDARHDLTERDHVGLTVWIFAWQQTIGLQRISGLRWVERDVDHQAVMVSPGYYDATAGKWLAKRVGATRFRNGVRTVVRLAPHYIVVDSWNNFAAGSYIEPNSDDENGLVESLAEAVRPPLRKAK